jgi:hypothetical protein
LAAGASLILAWGGDGTINEVASELVFRDVSFGVIPSGSGNGLARELKIPCNVEQAFATAFGASERVIDAGEIEGRLFFNLAGVGLDARVAHEFAATGLVRRGFARTSRSPRSTSFPSSQATTASLPTAPPPRRKRWSSPSPTDGSTERGRDCTGRADRRWQAGGDCGGRAVGAEGLAQMPMLFTGRIGQVSGITMMPARELTITSQDTMILSRRR